MITIELTSSQTQILLSTILSAFVECQRDGRLLTAKRLSDIESIINTAVNIDIKEEI